MITDSLIIEIFINKTTGKVSPVKCRDEWLNKHKDIKEYLDNRYPKNEFISYSSTIKRIRDGIEILPLCPVCKRPNKYFQIKNYCSLNCSHKDTERAKETGQKASITKKNKIKENPNIYTENFKLGAQKGNATKEKRSQEDPNYWKNIKDKEKTTRAQKIEEDPLYYKKIAEKGYNTLLQKELENPGYIKAKTEKMKITLQEHMQENPEKYKAAYTKGVEKGLHTKSLQGTNSKPEEYFYNELLKIFKKEDIFRNYNKDSRYPFNCDFYIKSKDLFIELNLFWTHGEHWFNKNNPKDIKLLTKLKEKETSSTFIQSAIDIWTNKDVIKRETAKNNNLNYVTIWTVPEIDLYISLNCPNGKDWEKEISWIKEFNMNLDSLIDWPKLNESFAICNKIAKKANWKEFYKRELKLWEDNNNHLQTNLLANRLKHKNKNPSQINSLELMQGLNISGKIRAYSSFDNTGFVKLLDKYNIQSVYDFCSGWGERLVTCAAKNIIYLGIDINNEVVKGQKQIIEYYNLTKQIILNNASENYIPDKNYDLVFTCPPYLNYEVYTDKGAENLKGQDFFNWWKQSIINASKCNPKYFAYQINQKNKESLNKVLEELGWHKIDQINLREKKNHFHKKDIIDYESIEIFEKLR